MNCNILFIIADDLNTAVAGYGTIPHAPTPHLDRLREKGVTFLNAQNNSPVCLPSRNALLSACAAPAKRAELNT